MFTFYMTDLKLLEHLETYLTDSRKEKFAKVLAQRTKHQLRRMPNLEFFIDDTLEYMDKIDKSLRGEENPIRDADLLNKRKKS